MTKKSKKGTNPIPADANPLKGSTNLLPEVSSLLVHGARTAPDLWTFQDIYNASPAAHPNRKNGKCTGTTETAYASKKARRGPQRKLSRAHRLMRAPCRTPTVSPYTYAARTCNYKKNQKRRTWATTPSYSVRPARTETWMESETFRNRGISSIQCSHKQKMWEPQEEPSISGPAAPS